MNRIYLADACKFFAELFGIFQLQATPFLADFLQSFFQRDPSVTYLKKAKNSRIANNKLIDAYIRLREDCTGNVIVDNTFDKCQIRLSIPEATIDKNTFDIKEGVKVIKNSERKQKLLPPLKS